MFLFDISHNIFDGKTCMKAVKKVRGIITVNAIEDAGGLEMDFSDCYDKIENLFNIWITYHKLVYM